MKKQVVFWSGVLGALLFALSSILGGLQIDGYSIISQYISESFATGLPNTSCLRLMYIIGGILLFVFGILIPSVLPKSKTLKIGFLLFAIFYGLGTITVALFPCDFGCPSDLENASLSQLIHNTAGFFTYAITPFGMIAIGIALQKWLDVKSLSKVSLICGVIALAFVFFLFSDAKGPYIGLFQRIIESSILFWIVYTAIYSSRFKKSDHMKKVILVFILALSFACVTKEKETVLVEYQQWHTITLPFEGPETSELADENPFLNYRLTVEFQHEESKYKVRGFYAADGNAAETSATSGGVWQVRFTPDKVGNWSYSAELHNGNTIALKDDGGELIEIENATGEFMVIPSDKKGADFRAHGRLVNDKGYFKFQDTDTYWIKGGADSPENLLAYEDFDSTYRMQSSNDEGEAKTNDTIHSYEPHLKDWQEGDPTWKAGKGKGLIGAMNYLVSKGMNVAYFLTMNIMGDGKDVWPYVSPDDFTRFDVSKLDQWEIVFQHMQSKGILLHMVLQETENETMLDSGDTGPMRQLYFQELVARFGHHLGMNFNLGEENGYAEFTPISQNDAQRKSMTDFLTQIDPYNHPILLHTHSHEPYRGIILDSIVGFKNLDGLSLQVDKREGAAEVVSEWKQKSERAGHNWMITMDEIGMWHTGAQSDSITPNHDSLRRYVLWGTLMSGAAGVEWYFGANNRYNDLNTEDWRTRDRLWELTKNAMDFFQDNLPYWEMRPNHNLVDPIDGYCFQKSGEVYAIYLPDSKEHSINLGATNNTFQVKWFNPISGGQLQSGSIAELKGGSIVSLGLPPRTAEDWVVLVKKKP